MRKSLVLVDRLLKNTASGYILQDMEGKLEFEVATWSLPKDSSKSGLQKPTAWEAIDARNFLIRILFLDSADQLNPEERAASIKILAGLTQGAFPIRRRVLNMAINDFVACRFTNAAKLLAGKSVLNAAMETIPEKLENIGGEFSISASVLLSMSGPSLDKPLPYSARVPGLGGVAGGAGGDAADARPYRKQQSDRPLTPLSPMTGRPASVSSTSAEASNDRLRLPKLV